MGKELRCPSCHRVTAAETLSYSEALGEFVCPICKAREAPAQILAKEIAAKNFEPKKPLPPPPKSKSQTALFAGLIALAAVITTIAILFSRSTPKPEDLQRAWDQAHHDEIIALKSQAETLAIAGKLPEAHAKYRQIETLIGGRQVKEPTLFDMVEVARQDQDRIYKLMLAKMEQKTGTVTQPAQDGASERPPQAVEPFKWAAPQKPSEPTPPAALARREDVPARSPTTSEPTRDTPPITPAQSPATTTASSEPSLQPHVRSDIGQSADYPRGLVSDKQIGDAIESAVNSVLNQFKNGEVDPNVDSDATLRAGLDALCVYALAVSGKAIVDERLSPKSPEMSLMLDKLKAYKLVGDGQGGTPITYARSLRACALATFNRPQDRDVLEDDVAWLINATTAGAYTYDDSFSPPYVPKSRRRALPATRPATPKTQSGQAAASDDVATYAQAAADDVAAKVILTDGVFTPRPPTFLPPPPRIFTNKLPQHNTLPPDDDRRKAQFPWDNSNSQYGLLGVWAGAEVGCEVPDNYWRLVQRHWESCQLPSGEWNYRGDNDPGYYAMTVAGVASLLVTHDYLEAPLLNTRVITAKSPYSLALSAGLAWLEDGDNCVNPTSAEAVRARNFFLGYNLYGMERVGLASGFKHFGSHNWFLELSSKALPAQWPNGAFGDQDSGRDALIDTSYLLLFLSRGRHPILMNKLRYDGNWTNRPREIANLANYTAREMERPLNWQVVDITREPSDWQDAPILYISGNKAPNFSDADIIKLADFVDQGGILFTHADLGSGEFTKYMTDLSKKLFPVYGPLRDLPTDHAIYSVNYPLPLPHPRLQGVSNGVRLLMIHSPLDLSNAWQVRATLSRKEPFQLGANLYLYATGKERFRNRLDTPVVPEPDDAPTRTVGLARLKYNGNWQPEPGAWPRFSRILQWQTGVKLDVKDVPLEQLQFPQTPLAHLTGTETFTPTDAQLAALTQFIQSGGTLLIDAAGGAGSFADGEASWLPKLLKDQKLAPLADNDPLLKHSADGTVDVPEKALRLYAMEQLRNDASRLKFARVGKGKIVFSSLDIVTGLLGTNTWGILGYQPEYSEALVKNWVLSSAP